MNDQNIGYPHDDATLKNIATIQSCAQEFCCFTLNFEIEQQLQPNQSLVVAGKVVEAIQTFCRFLCDNDLRVLPLFLIEELQAFTNALVTISRTRTQTYSTREPNQFAATKQQLLAIWSEREKHRIMWTVTEIISAMRADTRCAAEEIKASLHVDKKTWDDAQGALRQSAQQTIEQLAEKDRIAHKLILELKESKKTMAASQAQLNAIVDMKGLTDVAEHFNVNAEMHRETARNWLKATVILTVFTCILMTVFMSKIADGNVAIPVLIGKAALVSVLLGITAWTARNHRRHKHNQIAAENQKSSLLSVYKLYRAMDSGDRERGAVLMRAMDALVAGHTTGYASDDTGGDFPSLTRIHEIAKS